MTETLTSGTTADNTTAIGPGRLMLVVGPELVSSYLSLYGPR